MAVVPPMGLPPFPHDDPDPEEDEELHFPTFTGDGLGAAILPGAFGAIVLVTYALAGVELVFLKAAIFALIPAKPGFLPATAGDLAASSLAPCGGLEGAGIVLAPVGLFT